MKPTQLDILPHSDKMFANVKQGYLFNHGTRRDAIYTHISEIPSYEDLEHINCIPLTEHLSN